MFASSPPFSTLISTFLASKLKDSKFVIEIADLWPDTLLHLGFLNKSSLIYKAWRKIEIFLYNKASVIVALSNNINRDINDKLYNSKIKLITARNGFQADFWSNKKNFSPNKFTVGYYGKFGRAQALDTLIEAAKILEPHKNIQFKLAGSGKNFEKIKNLTNSYSLKNVEFYSEVSKCDLKDLWAETNLCAVSLKTSKVFKTAIPSKITESIGTGTPLLIASNECEATSIISENGFGLVCPPENPKAMAEKILNIVSTPEDYKGFLAQIYEKKHNFTRKAQAYRIIDVML